MSTHDCIPSDEWIPVFPLPNAVLLPRTVLPLHAFECRYRTMLSDALDGSRLIAMAMLRPGYEPTYDTHDAPIHETLCVGRIIRNEPLPDGRYNFVLQGMTRARIQKACVCKPYRRAKLEPIIAKPVTPELECVYRTELRRAICAPPLEAMATEAGWTDLFTCPELSFSDLVDVLAAAVFRCPEEKQRILETRCVSARVRLLCAGLHVLHDTLRSVTRSDSSCRPWPPRISPN